MTGKFKIRWEDSGREPRCAPNPEYPDGIDIDMSEGCAASCATALPYPARRCGCYVIECETCGLKTAVTTAGRPDDPRSLRVPCRQQPVKH